MEVEDFLQPEIAVTAVVTAAIFSPQARKVMRRGAVYGLAGILVASDAVASFGKSVGRGVKAASESVAQAANTTMSQAQATVGTEKGNGSTQAMENQPQTSQEHIGE